MSGDVADLEAQPWLTECNCGCDGLPECHAAKLELGDVWNCPTHLYIMTVMDKGLNASVGNRIGKKWKGKRRK